MWQVEYLEHSFELIKAESSSGISFFQEAKDGILTNDAAYM
jgi:hypothetical protein